MLSGILLCCFISSVVGHGRLLDPPARASMWRVGFSTPKNYNDNQLNCGGFMVSVFVYTYFQRNCNRRIYGTGFSHC